MAGRPPSVDLGVLVWAGACYWHGVGEFMFCSLPSHTNPHTQEIRTTEAGGLARRLFFNTKKGRKPSHPSSPSSFGPLDHRAAQWNSGRRVSFAGYAPYRGLVTVSPLVDDRSAPFDASAHTALCASSAQHWMWCSSWRASLSAQALCLGLINPSYEAACTLLFRNEGREQMRESTTSAPRSERCSVKGASSLC